MSSSPSFCCIALLVLGCGRSPDAPPTPPLAPELARADSVVSSAPSPVPPGDGRPDPRLPVVGDPLGLLGKPGPAQAKRHEQPGAPLSPGALSTPDTSGTRAAELERDPRAVARATAATLQENRSTFVGGETGPTQEASAREVLARIGRGAARPHVLLLYASYCPACRQVMPSFVELAARYKSRGVSFTAASVDNQQDAFDAYKGVLRGALEPLWIRPEGQTAGELRRAGLSIPKESYGIPLFAVFDKQRHVVMQGNSRELRSLPKILDGLL